MGLSSAVFSIEDHVREESRRTLDAYRAQPLLVREHVGIEEEVLSGGYGHRQIHELVQNAADAILEKGGTGRVYLLLTEEALYCANEGAPIDAEGIDAILHSHMSRKRGAQIGQFGIGFKSVLAISTRPEFHSRSGSFAFDGKWSEERVREVLPDVRRAPVLRLAKALPPAAVHGDTDLAELLSWATTVVRLPRTEGDTTWLTKDFADFPREFLLFSPHVAHLTLDDRATGTKREIEILHEGNLVVVSEGEEEAEWSVFQSDVRLQELSVEARFDADRKTRDRESVPLLWAVPHERKRVRGQFWAFFPTETETSLTGILNAPWKTNADRQNLLDGAFNRALLRKAAELVGASLAALYRSDDPGYLLDLLPARAADAAGWADEALIEELELELRAIECVANWYGTLRHPTAVGMRPDAAVTSAIGELLEGSGSESLTKWVHSSVERRERRAKAERIGVTKASITDWLESLASPATPESSILAIRAAGILEGELPRTQVPELRRAKIILTESSELVRASTDDLLLLRSTALADTAHQFVHPGVASDPQARPILVNLKVPELSPAWLLEQLLKGAAVDWNNVWPAARELSVVEAVAIFAKYEDRHTPHVKTLDGGFNRITTSLLPGQIVPASGERDSSVATDLEYHERDGELLRALGATEVPTLGVGGRNTEWFSDYLYRARRDLFAALEPGASRPQSPYLVFDPRTTAGPLDAITALSEEGRALMTRALATHLPSEHPWVLRHGTRPNAYPSLAFTPPIKWMLHKHGRLHTSLGIKKIEDCVSSALERWRDILPVADIDQASAAALELPATIAEFSDPQWQNALDQAQHVFDDRLLGGFYRTAAELIPTPDSLWCRAGDGMVQRPPSAIHVAGDPETADAHRAAAIPFVSVDDRQSGDYLVLHWGMRKAAGTVRYVPAADEAPVIDVFPGLRRYLPETHWGSPAQACENIWIDLTDADSERAISLPFRRVGECFCYVATLPDDEVVRAIALDAGLELSDDQVEDVLGYARREDRKRLIESIVEIDDLSEKLETLMNVPTLLSALPSGVQSILTERREHDLPLRVAQAALSVFGVDVLRHYSSSLAQKGLEPPTRWNGSPRAREFVDELGFPAEYAGFRPPRRDPAFEVDGPLDLRPLHDFQKEIGSRIKRFLRKPAPERGLVSLPTGSGKTRVAVQAFVEAIKEDGFDGLVVWMAQSDELCEQAVQSWSEVWRALGPRRRLRISRLWGATNNRVVEASNPHVVIATYQSLVRRLRSPGYEWLRNPACIIVDEAHGSIAPTYTDILAGFGFTAHETPRPLLGLTATPFRSAADPAETQWLVNRYGQQRFDHGVLPGDDPYPVLQDMGVLARVDQDVLEGSDLTLTPSELAELLQFKRLPPSAELRLGESKPRNSRLVESIKSLPSDWPVLLFATSVEHAHLMAAQLSLEGTSAKAISGETERGARRHYIEEFRRGRIRVLSNYNVLSTGFDAPALRALYIARPVFSPVLYQQMIGRGLRGPLNGGKERCLVVNVLDNIAQFGDQLAFRHFEYLWHREGASEPAPLAKHA